jgi:hypothetical protein
MLVLLLVGQPVLIAFLINLSQFRPGGNRQLDLTLTFAVVAAIWLGLNNTAREIVRDRAVYVRERRSVLNPESYLLGKVTLFAAIGLAQLALLIAWLRWCNFLDPEQTPEVHKALAQLPLDRLLLVLWLTYLSAMLLGLLISSLARTEEVAVAFLPLVILPQLLLSGVASDLLREQAGYFNSLPVLIRLTGEGARGLAGWALEAASLFTYSRPALVFFLNFEDRPQPPPDPDWVAVINWAHLLVLLLATATAFVAVFGRQERRWLERG